MQLFGDIVVREPGSFSTLADLVRERFTYDRIRGLLIFKKTGKIAGAKLGKPVESLIKTVNFSGCLFRVSSLIFMFHCDDLFFRAPKHRDGNCCNDRIENLYI